MNSLRRAKIFSSQKACFSTGGKLLLNPGNKFNKIGTADKHCSVHPAIDNYAKDGGPGEV